MDKPALETYLVSSAAVIAVDLGNLVLDARIFILLSLVLLPFKKSSLPDLLFLIRVLPALFSGNSLGYILENT
ncbi:hypothetical protein AHMF7605_20330 [Adhaeribacter arboris]|uniref:Uncharacterized protein n=1 Tax=Adhaeribacter arboris TaxID=2072846 RepID=A0A2T2YJJ7_9BACT|nr:hypothetical protein AHMF7605_20330 [Adhaeribacter arboris]